VTNYGRELPPGARLVEGYQPSTAEIGWLLAQLEQRPAGLIEPPPRSMVWLACWDCKAPNAVNRPHIAQTTECDGLSKVRTAGSNRIARTVRCRCHVRRPYQPFRGASHASGRKVETTVLQTAGNLS